MSQVDYLEILRLWALKYSKNRISTSVHSSHHTVEDVIAAAAASGIVWPLGDDVTNEDIQEILFPGRYAFASPYTMPDFQYIHEELAKKGVTLTLLWEEYCQRVRATGGGNIITHADVKLVITPGIPAGTDITIVAHGSQKSAPVRAKASSSAAKVGTVTAGQTGKLIKQEGAWYKVKVGDLDGYVYNWFVKVGTIVVEDD